MNPCTRFVLLAVVLLPLTAGNMGQGCVNLGAAGSLQNDTALPGDFSAVDMNSPDLNPGVEPLAVSDTPESGKAKFIFKNDTANTIVLSVGDQELVTLDANETSRVFQFDCADSLFVFGNTDEIHARMVGIPGLVSPQELTYVGWHLLVCDETTTVTFFIDDIGQLENGVQYAAKTDLNPAPIAKFIFKNNTPSTIQFFGDDDSNAVAAVAAGDTSPILEFSCGSSVVAGASTIHAEMSGIPGLFGPKSEKFDTFVSFNCGRTQTLTFSADSLAPNLLYQSQFNDAPAAAFIFKNQTPYAMEVISVGLTNTPQNGHFIAIIPPNQTSDLATVACDHITHADGSGEDQVLTAQLLCRTVEETSFGSSSDVFPRDANCGDVDTVTFYMGALPDFPDHETILSHESFQIHTELNH